MGALSVGVYGNYLIDYPPFVYVLRGFEWLSFGFFVLVEQFFNRPIVYSFFLSIPSYDKE